MQTLIQMSLKRKLHLDDHKKYKIKHSLQCFSGEKKMKLDGNLQFFTISIPASIYKNDIKQCLAK